MTAEVLNATAPAELQVGEWLVAPELNQISRDGAVLRLEPKAIELLVFLLQRQGEVVSRETLLTALWPGVVVGDNALTQVVTKLRKALGDTAREPTYIEAISKRGYRLIAPVRRKQPEVPAEAAAVGGPTSPALPAPPARTRPAARRWVVVGTLAALVALVVAVGVGVVQRRADIAAVPSPAGLPLSPRSAQVPTVIVRPIEAIGEDAGKLIARGLTADLINDLSKVSGLWVVSSVAPDGAARREAEPARVAAAGRYALAGTLQSDGKVLRLQVHLSDLDAGRQLWSQRFDRELRDLFAVQDELVRSILEQLPIEVSRTEKANLAQRYTRNIAAYEHFLRAQAAALARQREQNELARGAYWRAIELDPAFSRAYAGLAMTHALAYQLGWEHEAALDKAVELAATAVQLNPALPEAHWVVGFVETQRRRHTDAIGHLQIALRHNPSYADAYALLGGIRTYIGQPAEGVVALRTALRLNPDAGSLYFLLLGRALYFLGEHAQARVNLEQALTRNAENIEARVYLAAVLQQLGNRDGAAWQAQEIQALEPDFTVKRWLQTYPMTDEQQKERLAQTLRPLGL